MTHDGIACAARNALTMQRVSLRSALLVILLSSNATAADEVPPGQVVAVQLDGTTAMGPLLAFDANSVQLGPADDRPAALQIAADDLLSVEFSRRRSVMMPEAVLEFATGDWLAVEIGDSKGDALVVTAGETTLQVPLESLRGVRFRPSQTIDGNAAVMHRTAGADDLVVLTNGDRFAGQWLALSATELMLDVDGREVFIPRDRIATVAFSPELISARQIEGERQIVHTQAGWLTVSGLRRTADGLWQAETAFGEAMTWPAAAVQRVQFAGRRAVFLSEIEPISVEFVPYFDRVWPLRLDRDVTGEPLAVGDQTYAKGLGVHSRCRVTYELKGDYKTFHAVAGLAESAGSIGNVEFAVEVDGREVVRSGPQSRADAPLRINGLDVTDAETLVLTVDFGRNGDARDRANWCDAVLVK